VGRVWPRHSGPWPAVQQIVRHHEVDTVATIAAWTISIVDAIAIIVYATWLLTVRLRAGEPKGATFGQGLKHLFEAVWGL
jgi:hypothetical protein